MEITPKLKEALLENGIKSIEDLKKIDDLTKIPGVGKKKAEVLKKLFKS